MDRTSYAFRLDDDASLDAMLMEHKRVGIEGCATPWKRAARAHRFANGEQWPEDPAPGSNPEAQTRKNSSARLTMSEIEVIIQTLSGREMQQRFQREYLPRTAEAARSAEAMTAIDRAFGDASFRDAVESAVFKDGPGIGGLSWKRWEYDTLEDPRGIIREKNVPVWQMMWDPFCQEINLNDRSWHRFGCWVTRNYLRGEFPDKWATVRNRATSQSWADFEPSTSSREPWTGGSGMKVEESPWVNLRAQMFWLEREEWREITTVYGVAVPVGGMSYADAMAQEMAGQGQGQDPYQEVEMDPKTFGEFRRQHAAEHEGEQVPPRLAPKRQKAVYKYAYIVGDVILETGDIPTGYWTFQAQTGFRYSQPKKTIFRGLIERLMDPQRWVNVMISMLTRNMMQTPKATVVYEEGVFRDESDALSQINHPAGKIRVKRGTLSQYGGNPPFQIVSGGTQGYQTMASQMMEIWQSAIPRVAGFNPGALGQLGSDLRRISGEVVKSVQDAAMVANAELFDSKSQFSVEGAKIFLSFLRTFWANRMEELVEMIGEDLAYDEVIDPATGQPAVDPMTGQPQKKLAIPPPEAWQPSYWRSISVGESVPAGDRLEKLWAKFQSTLQVLMQPMPDTGKPIFSSEDIARWVPGIPAGDRVRLINRIRRDMQQMQAQQQVEAQQGEQQPQEMAA